MGADTITLDHTLKRAYLRAIPPPPGKGPKCAFDDDTIARTRYRYWAGQASQRELAAELDRTQAWVSMLVNFRIAPHVR